MNHRKKVRTSLISDLDYLGFASVKPFERIIPIIELEVKFKITNNSYELSSLSFIVYANKLVKNVNF